MKEFEKYYKQFYGDLNDSKHYLLGYQFWQASAKRSEKRIEWLLEELRKLQKKYNFATETERKRIVDIIEDEKRRNSETMKDKYNKNAKVANVALELLKTIIESEEMSDTKMAEKKAKELFEQLDDGKNIFGCGVCYRKSVLGLVIYAQISVGAIPDSWPKQFGGFNVRYEFGEYSEFA